MKVMQRSDYAGWQRHECFDLCIWPSDQTWAGDQCWQHDAAILSALNCKLSLRRSVAFWDMCFRNVSQRFRLSDAARMRITRGSRCHCFSMLARFCCVVLSQCLTWLEASRLHMARWLALECGKLQKNALDDVYSSDELGYQFMVNACELQQMHRKKACTSV